MAAHARKIDWVKEGWGLRCETVDSLLRAVSRIGTFQLGRRYVWRGVRNAGWPIQSSLQRNIGRLMPSFDYSSEANIREAERVLIKAAREWRLDAAGTLTDQALLALMQHHDSPTRLLDVTSDPMTALWFATESSTNGERNTSGALFAFDVTDAPSLHTSAALNPATYGSIDNPGWHLARAIVDTCETRQPCVLDPSIRDDRMASQQGLFLFGSTPDHPIIDGIDAFEFDPRAKAPGSETLTHTLTTNRRQGRPPRLPFVALVFPPGIKRTLRIHLETTYNRSRPVLFPDFAGLAAAVRLNAISWPALGPDAKLTV
ncbi:FRG domain-containing protein [Isoptericola sp. NPDC019693]|uniref:FRG domain-containing protein n=1 Tax=Isoptericola sp. NPDC019693 TaxID=3364009 RepID=UPI00378D1D0A